MQIYYWCRSVCYCASIPFLAKNVFNLFVQKLEQIFNKTINLEANAQKSCTKKKNCKFLWKRIIWIIYSTFIRRKVFSWKIDHKQNKTRPCFLSNNLKVARKQKCVEFGQDFCLYEINMKFAFLFVCVWLR